MARKKYKILKYDTIKIGNATLHRIKALRSFNGVKRGNLGGYIETEYNLSQKGNCWVYGNAKVYGNACVLDDAVVGGYAEVFGNARIYGTATIHGCAKVCNNADIHGDSMIYDHAVVAGNTSVYGNARIYGKACVNGCATICNDAWVSGYASICDAAIIYRNAHIDDHSCVSGYASIGGAVRIGNHAKIKDASIYNNESITFDARIYSDKDYLSVSGVGNASIIFYNTADGIIHVNAEFFDGILDEFRDKVKDICDNTELIREYLALSIIAEWRLTGKQKEE